MASEDIARVRAVFRKAIELSDKGHVFRAVENYVRAVEADCDGDALLIQVEQVGVACHTGSASCFDVSAIEAVTDISPGSLRDEDVGE
jgi:phosphoribosyl-AMP cyclohydrolase